MELTQHTFGGFILIEGPDTAGKSTQSQLLKERLESKGLTVELLHFPDYESSFGKMIKTFLKNEVSDSTFEQFLSIQMVYIADQLAAQKKIQDKIQEGVWVIADRYDFSTLAYSYAKVHTDSLLLVETFNALRENGIFRHVANMQAPLIKPDLTFVLDLPYQEIKKRKQELDGFESNDIFMEKVAEAYSLLALNPLNQNRTIIKMDATESIESIHQEIVETVETFNQHCIELTAPYNS